MEEFKITDKSALEQNNMCNNCKKLLNVTPIFCLEKDGIVTKICGRCSDTVNRNGKKCRQYAYENMAQFLTFPCCNTKFGCDAILNWNQVSDHEIVCAFKPILCPLSYDDLFPNERCTWMGNMTKLNEHIETSHRKIIRNPPHYDWDTSLHGSGYYRIFFTNVGVRLVTVVIKHENQKIYSLLMLNGNDVESQCFRYQLEVFDENKENSMTFRKSRLEPLGSIKENLNIHEKMLVVDTDILMEMLRTNVLHGRFGIVEKNNEEIIQITGGKKHGLSTSPVVAQAKVSSIDETMLQELECPVCKDFMTAPIFICHTGHSICGECKSEVSTCPTCRSNFAGARNFTLEKLTTKVNYPCRNKEIGCPFVTTAEHIRKHEAFCKLAEICCVFGCGYKCLKKDMYNHLVEKHRKSLLQVDTLLVWDINDREPFYVLYSYGELFRFRVGTGSLSSPSNSYNIPLHHMLGELGGYPGNRILTSPSNSYDFHLQHMGMIEGEPKYRYQLQFIDQSPLKLDLIMTNVCQCPTDDNWLVANNNMQNHLKNMQHKTTALSVPVNLLEPLISKSKLFYKIIISKV